MKQRNILLSLIIVILIVSGVFFSGIFSIIGVGEIGNEVCVFNETNKECTIQIEVPESRSLSFYTFDMDFEAVPEAEFKGLTSVNAFVNGGSYTEEDDKDLTFSLEEREYNYLWLYRLPATWGTPYEIKTIARVSEASAVVTQDSATSEVELYTGVFFEDYPYSTIEVCNEYYTRDCPNPYYLVQIYDNSRNEQQVRFSSDVQATRIFVDGTNNDVYSSNVNEPEVAPLYWEGTNLVNTYIYPFENMAVYVHIQVADEEQSYATQTWTPPTLQMMYKEAIYPTNVKYGINNRVFDTLEGANEAGVVTSLEISDQINDYCGRNDNASGACVFELTITSDTIGKLIVVDENAVLGFAEGDTSCAKKGGCVVEEVIAEPEPTFFEQYVNFSLSKEGRDINTLTTYLVIFLIISAVVLYVRRK